MKLPYKQKLEEDKLLKHIKYIKKENTDIIKMLTFNHNSNKMLRRKPPLTLEIAIRITELVKPIF